LLLDSLYSFFNFYLKRFTSSIWFIEQIVNFFRLFIVKNLDFRLKLYEIDRVSE